MMKPNDAACEIDLANLTSEQRTKYRKVMIRRQLISTLNQALPGRVGGDGDVDEGRWVATRAIYGERPTPLYQTAIKHPAYAHTTDGCIVVAEYEDLDEAKAGHVAWVERVLYNDPPAEVRDVDSGELASFTDEVRGTGWRVFRAAMDVDSTETIIEPAA